jgi:HJR/Mrr/RecB family endonuclease
LKDAERLSRKAAVASRLLLPALGWLPPSLVAAAVAAIATAVILIACSVGVKGVAFGLASVYVCVFGVTAVVLHDLETSGGRLADVRTALERQGRLVSAAAQRLRNCHSDQRLAASARAAKERYELAVREYQRLQALFASRRYHLLNSDWRSLRGVPFEEFLAEVFRALGYRVETTRASGDQGADLILTKADRRIAVQAKGYGGSVSNSAVQEVHASKSVYHCAEAVAITNSTFTPQAKELAHAVGCRLIDGAGIPALIRGEIL